MPLTNGTPAGPADPFDRDQLAACYANRHLTIDPDVEAIFYLPANAPPKEIRLLEVNPALPTLTDDVLEPIDFGVDVGGAEGHSLVVLDVTPDQWTRIEQTQLRLPAGWELNPRVPFSRGGRS